MAANPSLPQTASSHGHRAVRFCIVAGVALAGMMAGIAVTALDGASRLASLASWEHPRSAPRTARQAGIAMPPAAMPAPETVPMSLREAAAMPKHEEAATPRRSERAGRALAQAALPDTPGPGRKPAAARRAGSVALRAAARTPDVDARYAAATARECRPGFCGLVCRERVRWRLCDGRWSGRPRAGATRCHVARSQAPEAGG